MQKTSGGLGKLCVMMDYVGFSLRNAPAMKISMATLNVMQNHYPETMGQAFFVSPPLVFKGFWKVGGWLHKGHDSSAWHGEQVARGSLDSLLPALIFLRAMETYKRAARDSARCPWPFIAFTRLREIGRELVVCPEPFSTS